MRFLPVGERGVLVELPDGDTRRRLESWLAGHELPGLVSHVPAARTVLLTADRPERLAVLRDRLQALDLADVPEPGRQGERVTVPVRYDGPDLAEVAELLGLSPQEVVRRHTGQEWRVEFVGFLPGFAYLGGASGGLTVPRRDSPRTRIEPGSVGLAGEWSGIYPSASPGGWQLIGRTDVRLFDADREPEVLLPPGTTVRFEEVGA
ncbi:allophanate hydrolase subunit 1 [Luteipulveratus sp. YIM 133132]|uniref:5-oxoprolinase subunit B family protein n=1 Tax=Luteipulveratus flavus TaxID=3031728 RepID=UPI0023B1107A|nr:allophanate hydrolase subunit 1 [Luteipulveratus sp. YIM 133132]MDE9365286.1 allophanate hydrolase subunit 1 [Luteipulveratus sp. YIM 133132]